MKKIWKPQPTKAVESLINIRYDFVPVETITQIFLEKKPYSEKYQTVLLEFFNEVPISIMKRYMEEQHISREQIIRVFNILPDCGEKISFMESIESRDF